MNDLKLCPFHNSNTCGCYDSVDVQDESWNKRPIEDKYRKALEIICKFDLKPYENELFYGANKLKMIAYEALK